MKNKGYLHIVEYDLTKKILDRLDVDIEDDFELVQGILPLYYKDKTLILPSYDKCINYMSEEVIFRPFTNINHANYLINLVSDAKKCEILFEYKDGKDNTLDGTLKVHLLKKKKDCTVNFFGIKNQSVLMTLLIMKQLLNKEDFKDVIGSIFKIDRKLSDSHKSEEK